MMDLITLALGWVGIYSVLLLSVLGSAMACSKAGQAAIGAMLESESGYGRYAAVAALPASQAIFGIVVMFALNRAVTLQNALPLLVVGLMTGFALLFCSIKEGECCASAIMVSKEKPEVFGVSLAPAAVIEGFSVFAFVFALLVSGGIPK